MSDAKKMLKELSYTHLVPKDEQGREMVAVVRCKDCVHYCGFASCNNGICDVDSVSKRAVYPNDYCSYGERKDDDEITNT